MQQFSDERHPEMTAIVEALAAQLATRVPLYRDPTGTVLVPLHPLLDAVELAPVLEATALTLLHPHPCTFANGVTVLMVPLGEALAVLPFSRHFPEALALVTQIEALRTDCSHVPAVTTARLTQRWQSP